MKSLIYIQKWGIFMVLFAVLTGISRVYVGGPLPIEYTLLRQQWLAYTCTALFLY